MIGGNQQVQLMHFITACCQAHHWAGKPPVYFCSLIHKENVEMQSWKRHRPGTKTSEPDILLSGRPPLPKTPWVRNTDPNLVRGMVGMGIDSKECMG